MIVVLEDVSTSLPCLFMAHTTAMYCLLDNNGKFTEQLVLQIISALLELLKEYVNTILNL